MAKVPYSPVPTVAPQAGHLPRPSIATPEAAFGSSSSRAMVGFGKELQRTGDVIFARATALQQTINDAEAREADAQYMTVAGNLHAKYQSLQGRDRVQAYPQYQIDLKESRAKIRGTLSNPAVQKLYDAQTMGTMSRAIFNGAGSAASANKVWTASVVASQLELDLKGIENDPSKTNLDYRLARIEASAANLAAQQGYRPEDSTWKLAIKKARSKAFTSQVMGLARVDPEAGVKLLYNNKKEFMSDDFLRAESNLLTRGRAVAADKIANEVFRPDRPLPEMEAEATALAKKKNPHDQLLDNSAIAAIRQRYNQFNLAKVQQLRNDKEVLAEAMVKNKVKHVNDLASSPETAEAWDRLPAVEQAKYPGMIARYNNNIDKPVNDANFTRLMGMAGSDSADARSEFMNVDPTTVALSNAQVRMVWKKQAEMRESTAGDPRVARGMNLIRANFKPQLEDADILRRDDDKEAYDHFTGALGSALYAWNEAHKKRASDVDIVETIAPQLFKERVTPGAWWGKTWPDKTPLFEQTISESAAKAVREELGDPNASDAEVYKRYMRHLFKLMYDKSGPKTQERAPARPVTPVTP